jgi:DNA-binding Lrp family transcriptional regulator
VDKEILKVLLDPQGNVSTQVLAERIGVPLSTVQRRRKHLESMYLDVLYSLKLTNLGYRRIDFFLYTGGGNTSDVGLELLKQKAVVSVSRSVGEHTIDLRAEAVIRDNGQLLDLLEAMKAMPNVRDVIWSEIVDVIGRKKSVPSDVIDSL